MNSSAFKRAVRTAILIVAVAATGAGCTDSGSIQAQTGAPEDPSANSTSTSTSSTSAMATTTTTPPRSDSTTTTGVTPPTPTSTTASTTTPTSPGGNPRDWDGVRWDLGEVTKVRTEGSNVIIDFDRVQAYLGPDLQDATAFTSEPIIAGNSDSPIVNDNPQLRSYSVSPAAVILEMTNAPQACVSTEFPEMPQWTQRSLDSLVFEGSLDGNQTALTFDSTGQVVQIRHSLGC